MGAMGSAVARMAEHFPGRGCMAVLLDDEGCSNIIGVTDGHFKPLEAIKTKVDTLKQKQAKAEGAMESIKADWLKNYETDDIGELESKLVELQRILKLMKLIGIRYLRSCRASINGSLYDTRRTLYSMDFREVYLFMLSRTVWIEAKITRKWVRAVY